MPISEKTEFFHDKALVDFDPQVHTNPSTDVVYRLAVEYDSPPKSMQGLIETFLNRIDPAGLDALVIGLWNEPYENGANEIIETLITHAPKLPALRALFIGDMTFEECEISWIIQGSYKPLLDAFPDLEVLRIRGATNLKFEPFEHAHLQTLIIESGGLPGEVLEALVESTMPMLAHLELWAGDENYGMTGDINLYRRVVAALDNPNLRTLGLRDAPFADELAEWLATDPLLGRLEVLDLSLGTIGDRGAQALIASPFTRHLKKLDLSHHYISEELQWKLKALPFPAILRDQQDLDEDDRYVAVGE